MREPPKTVSDTAWGLDGSGLLFKETNFKNPPWDVFEVTLDPSCLWWEYMETAERVEATLFTGATCVRCFKLC